MIDSYRNIMFLHRLSVYNMLKNNVFLRYSLHKYNKSLISVLNINVSSMQYIIINHLIRKKHSQYNLT